MKLGPLKALVSLTALQPRNITHYFYTVPSPVHSTWSLLGRSAQCGISTKCTAISFKADVPHFGKCDLLSSWELDRSPVCPICGSSTSKLSRETRQRETAQLTQCISKVESVQKSSVKKKKTALMRGIKRITPQSKMQHCHRGYSYRGN